VTTIWTLLQARTRTAPGTPLVTFIDGTAIERTELSALSLQNAAAKIANALRDEYDLEPGALVSVQLPVHWQRSTWCAGIWTAGCVLRTDTGGEADLVVTDLSGVAGAVAAGAHSIAVVSLHPFGLPLVQPVPPPAHDSTVVVRQQPDAYLFDPPHESDPALQLADGTVLTQAEVAGRAAGLAAQWSLAPGGRLLATERTGGRDGWLAALAVPLAMGGSVVLCSGVADERAMALAEKVTATASPSA
jgi:uncharacterized protein (TIGR03089 family)